MKGPNSQHSLESKGRRPYAAAVQLNADLLLRLAVGNVVHFGGGVGTRVVKEILPAIRDIGEIHLVRAQLDPR